MKQIVFNDADKYVVHEDYYDVAPFKPTEDIRAPYGTFWKTGEYIVNRGFLFSANFPAINTFNTRRAACVHDFFYTLMKDGYLDKSYRDHADYLLYDHLREDGMPSFRAFYWLKAVQVAGGAVLNSSKPKPQRSPKLAKYATKDKFGMA
jgi:hypothetical protein